MTPKIAIAAALAAVLAACAPKPAPEPMTMSPTYDKLGGAICPVGYQVATNSAGQTVCAPL